MYGIVALTYEIDSLFVFTNDGWPIHKRYNDVVNILKFSSHKQAIDYITYNWEDKYVTYLMAIRLDQLQKWLE